VKRLNLFREISFISSFVGELPTTQTRLATIGYTNERIVVYDPRKRVAEPVQPPTVGAGNCKRSPVTNVHVDVPQTIKFSKTCKCLEYDFVFPPFKYFISLHKFRSIDYFNCFCS
jgi:hypothetical protein